MIKWPNKVSDTELQMITLTLRMLNPTTCGCLLAQHLKSYYHFRERNGEEKDSAFHTRHHCNPHKLRAAVTLVSYSNPWHLS